MLPRILHRNDKRKYRDLDYEADVLGCIDYGAISYRKADEFNFADYDVGARESFAIDIKDSATFELGSTSAASATPVEQKLDRPGLIRRMLDVIPNPWQGARILDDALAALRKRASDTEIIDSRLTLIEDMRSDLSEQTEKAAEEVFRCKVRNGDIVFKLLAAPLDDLNFEFLECFETHVAYADSKAPLLNTGGAPLDRALYDRVFKKDFNEFEEQVALYLDGRDAVNWWWRIAARRDWGLQGWAKNKIYPDFLVRLDANGEMARLLVLETKGKHLEGSQDTEFKSKFFQLLEQAYSAGREAGDVELFADSPDVMRFRILIQEAAWKSDLEGVIS